MPNVKIFVDEQIYPRLKPALQAALPGIRDYLCAELEVTHAACQFAVLPVLALPDQPQVNVELALMPREERTREKLGAMAGHLRQILQDLGVEPVAIRLSALDPLTYIALK